MKYNTIDLFAGCGGLTDGFEKAGNFSTIAAVEWDKNPCANLVNRLKRKWKHENASEEVMCFDIQRTNELFSGYSMDSVYGSHSGLDAIINGRPVDMIIGGPPCQAYSIAGRIRDEHGMQDDYRNFLFESYIKVVCRYKPKFFLFENVSGILSATPGGVPIIKRILESFNSAGYYILPELKNAVYDLTEFGIPQKRKRIIILGVSKEWFPNNFVNIVHDFYFNVMPTMRESVKTVYDAIGDLPVWHPEIVNGKVVYKCQSGQYPKNHIPRTQSVRDLGVFKTLTEDIENKTYAYVSTEALKQLYTQITGHVSNIHKYYVLRWDEPSNTIPAHLYKDGYRHIHPSSKQLRTLTVREAARLQTFDDDYEFLGSMMAQYKMIGNAVPSKFAYKLAQSMNILFQKYVPEKQFPSVNLFSNAFDLENVANIACPEKSGKEVYFQPTLFEQHALYFFKDKSEMITLLGTYHIINRDWIVSQNKYNYPITDDDLKTYPELLRVKKLILKHRNNAPLYFSVNGYAIVDIKKLISMGYKTSASTSNNNQYILYNITPMNEPIPPIILNDLTIVGKGMKKIIGKHKQ